MRIYVGNLQRKFSEVNSVSIIRDRDTRRSKGIAFVDMPLGIQAKAAIKALNGKIFHQPTCTLTVNEARPLQGRHSGNGAEMPTATPDRPKLHKRSRGYRR